MDSNVHSRGVRRSHWCAASAITFFVLGLCCGVSAQPDGSPLDALDPAEIPNALRLDGQSPEIVAVVRGHKRAVASLVFSQDCKTLVSAGWDNKLIWWGVSDKKLTEAKSGA